MYEDDFDLFEDEYSTSLIPTEFDVKILKDTSNSLPKSITELFECLENISINNMKVSQ